MAVVINPESMFIGAAVPMWRAIGGTGAWTSLGITVDDAVVRLTTEWFRPDNINGTLGPIMGLDILTGTNGEIEFSVPGITAANLSKILPGSTSVAQATTDAGGTPGSTTLAAAAVPGDTTLLVTAITNFTAGDFVRVETGGSASVEYRQIDVVGTAGSGGTGLQFADPLLYAHANATVVVETVGDGRTVISAPTVRRQPTSAYFDWRLSAPSGTKYAEVRLLNAISATESIELGFGDETLAAVRVTIQSRVNGATPTASPFQIIVPT